jgi:phenylalanyl-tRNA synthetase alpha chain
MSSSNQYQANFEAATSISQCIVIKETLLKSDQLASLLQELKSSSPDQKKLLGGQITSLKSQITVACDSKIQALQALQEEDNFIKFDPTFSSNKFQEGKQGVLHPIIQVSNEIVGIFQRLGFDIFDSTQVESQWYNFTSVGTPDYHSARGMQDTFFLAQEDGNGEKYVMRTQVTSNICKYTETHKPPFRVVFPGLVFRAENMDSTHDINFHQLDMWMVDKQISISQLVTLLEKVFREYFNDPELQVRLRPSYFPFTEPSFEIDIYAKWFKGGKWIEVAGAGPIHRQVIKNMGLDDNEYQGIAFGLGLTRLVQMKLQITGITQFYNGQLSFLRGE